MHLIVPVWFHNPPDSIKHNPKLVYIWQGLKLVECVNAELHGKPSNRMLKFQWLYKETDPGTLERNFGAWMIRNLS
jgi:hypothetical protein